MKVKVVVPIKLPSLANSRFHWRKMAKVKKDQKYAVALCLESELNGVDVALPATVTITRIGKRLLDSHDNLRSACKYVVDEIASHLGEDDASPLYVWFYQQRIGKEYSVEIEIETETK